MIPTKPEDIIKEIFDVNSEIIDNFSKHFSKELLDFAESFSEAYKKHLELDRLITGPANIQIAYVSGLVFTMLDNLLISVKLFVMGYSIPSGNLMRQVIESIPLMILCSLKDNIRIKTKKNKTKTIHFYTSFLNNKSEAQSHKAIHHLEMNYQDIGINKDAIDTLKKARKFYHNYSHPTQFSMTTKISSEIPNTSYIGGCFDNGKIEDYKKELVHRNNFCRIIPNIIDGLIISLKLLL